MPVFTKNGKSFLFIHTPKTGGSSLEKLFIKSGYNALLLDGGPNSLHHVCKCSPQHWHSRILQTTLKLDKMDGIFMFARHPFARIKSEYAMRTHTKYDPTEPALDRWVTNTLQKYIHNNYIYDNHIRPQSEFYIAGTTVFKIEYGFINIIKDINRLFNTGLEAIDIRIMDRNKASGFSSKSIRISDVTKERLSNFYSADFSMFQYEKYDDT